MLNRHESVFIVWGKIILQLDMDKRKIVKIVAKKNGMSQKDVTMVFDEIFSTMLEGLKEEGHVGVLGFGSFNVKKCAVRHRYVLSTQKVVLYPENKKIIFRVAKQFKFKADGLMEEKWFEILYEWKTPGNYSRTFPFI